uniref:Uncharacterized protein n=1 Tax=Oryza meyeriana var. granulata TaxID=110450 RepID=A0A1V1H3U8_9ORYZ|nr:hypothetical protein [Oryza meyeriana var. granulata]
MAGSGRDPLVVRRIVGDVLDPFVRIANLRVRRSATVQCLRAQAVHGDPPAQGRDTYEGVECPHVSDADLDLGLVGHHGRLELADIGP